MARVPKRATSVNGLVPLVTSVVTALSLFAPSSPNALPAAEDRAPSLRLVGVESGTSGVQDGAIYRIEDPRNVFTAGEDRQVTVCFEWEGRPGPLRLEGRWKDPSGQAVLVAPLDYDVASPRFTLYWTLALPEALMSGLWALEVYSGEERIAGHTFQIATPEGAARALDVGEVYQRALTATLTVEALDASGARIRLASGFFVAPDLLLTTFGAINAAHLIRIHLPSEGHVDTSEVVLWDPRGDQAVLRVPGAEGREVERGQEEPTVGDRCYFLEAQLDGSRAIETTTVVGRSASGDLLLRLVTNEPTHGSPVFNQYGQVVAAIRGHGLLGATVHDVYAISDPGSSFGGLAIDASARVLGAAPEGSTASRTLQDLEKSGAFVMPLKPTPHHIHGVLGTGVDRDGPVSVAMDQRFRFSRREAKCVVFLTWTGGRTEDSTSTFVLFDEHNGWLVGSEPARIMLRTGRSYVQSWELKPAGVGPGIYRVDVLLGVDPVWRTFFRITE